MEVGSIGRTRWLCNDCCRTASPPFLGVRREGGKSASKAKPRDNFRRRRFTPLSTASSAGPSLRRWDVAGICPYSTGNSAEPASAACKQPAAHRRIADCEGDADGPLDRADVPHAKSHVFRASLSVGPRKDRSSRIEPRVEGSFSMHSFRVPKSRSAATPALLFWD